MISLRSRTERTQERYSRASLCACSERSMGSDDDDSIEMTIEVEVCSTPVSHIAHVGKSTHTTVLPYCFLLFSGLGRIFFETTELILT